MEENEFEFELFRSMGWKIIVDKIRAGSPATVARCYRETKTIVVNDAADPAKQLEAVYMLVLIRQEPFYMSWEKPDKFSSEIIRMFRLGANVGFLLHVDMEKKRNPNTTGIQHPSNIIQICNNAPKQKIRNHLKERICNATDN